MVDGYLQMDKTRILVISEQDQVPYFFYINIPLHFFFFWLFTFVFLKYILYQVDLYLSMLLRSHAVNVMGKFWHREGNAELVWWVGEVEESAFGVSLTLIAAPFFEKNNLFPKMENVIYIPRTVFYVPPQAKSLCESGTTRNFLSHELSFLL